MRSRFAVLAGLLVVTGGAAAAHAQIVNGGDLVTVDYSNLGVYRVQPSGTVTLLHQGGVINGPSGVTVTPDRDILIANYNNNTIYRLSNAGVLTPLAVVPGGPIRIVMDVNGDCIVAVLTTGLLRRVTPAGVVTTIASGFNRPFGIAVEPDGNFLVTEDTSGRLSRVDRTTGAATVLATGLGLAQGVALFHDGDYAVMSGNPDLVWRIPRAGGAPVVLVGSQPLGNPDGMVGDFAGGLWISESGAPNGSRVVHVTSTGALTVLAAGSPFQNLEAIAIVPRLRGPVLPSTGPGSSYVLDLDCPGEAGAWYGIGASLSTFPGVALPAPDPRGAAVNLDSLFLLTFANDFPPFTTGWSGFLGGSGQASATLDLSAVAPGLLAGLSLHVQGLTLDSLAPSGIGSFTNVHTLRF